MECQISVHGKGSIDRIYWFRGNYLGNELGSIPGFDYVFNPCPNFLEKKYFHASEYTSINAGHETFAWGFALNSGPLCLAFSNDLKPPWLVVGVATEEGNYDFQSFEFNHKPESVLRTHDSILGTQSLSLAYYGHRNVSGVWKTPRLVFQIADDKYAAVKKYVGWLYHNEYLKPTSRKTFTWWKKPIFCGWHEQVAKGLLTCRQTNLSKMDLESGARAFVECTQENYTRWLNILSKKGICPGIIIIDALWQVACDTHLVDKTKWPDLREFIDDRHRRGQKVLLWIDAWKRAKVPPDECLCMNGKPLCPDPTHPKYIRRLQDQLCTMLADAPGCYNADGLKIDGTSLQPYGYGMKTYGDVYGYELQKRLIKLIHDEAKSVKPDALISVFIANPYFNDVCDMVRLGDMYTVKGDPLDSMKWRKEILEMAMPGKVIDTDGQLRFSVRPNYINLIDEQARMGVPTLYNAFQMMRRRTFTLPIHRTFTKAEYRHITKAFHLRSVFGSKSVPSTNINIWNGPRSV